MLIDVNLTVTRCEKIYRHQSMLSSAASDPCFVLVGVGCWGGMVTRTGGSQKLQRGEATVLGAGASWPHM